ncbi:hypothetical protein BOTBODRAFT_27786 [Botryobasidium botryosum FD-172 SS1]|uniref:RING-type domain-containing protein n=1 Tax=Botryobasidium botryosum (strain FD-172 SS1) TaxID=930990 RepID=A0A067MXQ0_BOTB1|nr:hypothetical protein BOTBODRAFT_27786 [Botryobasidium botryosum FD-172 SS1]
MSAYGADRTPTALPCGHVYCDSCTSTHIARSTAQALPLTCPQCRKSFQRNQVQRLYIDFSQGEPDEEEAPEPQTTLTPAEVLKARELAARLSAIGIETRYDEMEKALREVKNWIDGAESIEDTETKIAITRLLLQTSLLQSKVAQDKAHRLRIRELQKSTSSLKLTVSALQAQAQEQETLLNEAQSELDYETDRCDELETELRAARTQLIEIGGKYTDEQEQKMAWQEKFKAAESACHFTQNSLRSLNDELGMAEGEIRRLEAVKRKLDARNTELEKQLEMAKAEHSRDKRKIRDLEAAITMQGKEAQDSRRIQREADSRTAALKADLDSANNKITELEKNRRELNREREKWKQKFENVMDQSLTGNETATITDFSSPPAGPRNAGYRSLNGRTNQMLYTFGRHAKIPSSSAALEHRPPSPLGNNARPLKRTKKINHADPWLCSDSSSGENDVEEPSPDGARSRGFFERKIVPIPNRRRRTRNLTPPNDLEDFEV